MTGSFNSPALYQLPANDRGSCTGMVPPRITGFVTMGLGLGSLEPLRDPWPGKLGWITRKWQPGLLSKPCRPTEAAWISTGWLASLAFGPHCNPGTQGLIAQRQEEHWEMKPRKCQECFLWVKGRTSLSHPPTSGPSQDTEWGQVGATGHYLYPLGENFKRERGPKWNPPKGRFHRVMARPTYPPHTPLSPPPAQKDPRCSSSP